MIKFTPQQAAIIAHIKATPGITGKRIAVLIDSTEQSVMLQIFRMRRQGKLGRASLENGYVFNEAAP